jgi:hypothetical protein
MEMINLLVHRLVSYYPKFMIFLLHLFLFCFAGKVKEAPLTDEEIEELLTKLRSVPSRLYIYF